MFYPTDLTEKSWVYEISVSVGHFNVLQDLLLLESPYGDMTCEASPEILLAKVAHARMELAQYGQEWESSEVPTEGAGVRGLHPGTLSDYLCRLEQLALFCKEHRTNVRWS